MRLEMYLTIKDLLTKIWETWRDLKCTHLSKTYWINCRRLELTWNVLICQEPNEENIRDLRSVEMYSSIKDKLTKILETWGDLKWINPSRTYWQNFERLEMNSSIKGLLAKIWETWRNLKCRDLSKTWNDILLGLSPIKPWRTFKNNMKCIHRVRTAPGILPWETSGDLECTHLFRLFNEFTNTSIRDLKRLEMNSLFKDFMYWE